MDKPSSCGANAGLVENDLLGMGLIGGGSLETGGKRVAETSDISGGHSFSPGGRLAGSIAGNDDTPHDKQREGRILGMRGFLNHPTIAS